MHTTNNYEGAVFRELLCLSQVLQVERQLAYSFRACFSQSWSDKEVRRADELNVSGSGELQWADAVTLLTIVTALKKKKTVSVGKEQKELEKDGKMQLKCNLLLACKGISPPMRGGNVPMNSSFKGGRSGLLPGSWLASSGNCSRDQ